MGLNFIDRPARYGIYSSCIGPIRPKFYGIIPSYFLLPQTVWNRSFRPAIPNKSLLLMEVLRNRYVYGLKRNHIVPYKRVKCCERCNKVQSLFLFSCVTKNYAAGCVNSFSVRSSFSDASLHWRLRPQIGKMLSSQHNSKRRSRHAGAPGQRRTSPGGTC